MASKTAAKRKTLTEFQTLVVAYTTAKTKADDAKAKADAAKNALLDFVQTTAPQTTERGTHRVPIDDQSQVKIAISRTFKVDQTAMKAAASRLPAAIGAALIRWKPEVNAAVFDALAPYHQLIAGDFIESKNGAPSLSIEPIAENTTV